MNASNSQAASRPQQFVLGLIEALSRLFRAPKDAAARQFFDAQNLSGRPANGDRHAPGRGRGRHDDLHPLSAGQRCR